MKKPRVRTRTWVAALAAILGVCVLWILWAPRKPSMIADIYSDGKLLRRVDLNRVKTAERYVVEYYGESNTILIEPGRICVESADCPDQICVMEGWLPGFGLPIVCLPHNLLIQIEDGAP
ncbi:MAG: NusG domain II-containing protein [Oscillibacter sp.]|nr:NusG domain II-containing protein [Oscillibacter sp.]